MSNWLFLNVTTRWEVFIKSRVNLVVWSWQLALKTEVAQVRDVWGFFLCVLEQFTCMSHWNEPPGFQNRLKYDTLWGRYVDGLGSFYVHFSSPRTFYEGLRWLILLFTVRQPLFETMLEEIFGSYRSFTAVKLLSCQSPQQMVETLKSSIGSDIRVLGKIVTVYSMHKANTHRKSKWSNTHSILII